MEHHALGPSTAVPMARVSLWNPGVILETLQSRDLLGLRKIIQFPPGLASFLEALSEGHSGPGCTN